MNALAQASLCFLTILGCSGATCLTPSPCNTPLHKSPHKNCNFQPVAEEPPSPPPPRSAQPTTVHPSHDPQARVTEKPPAPEFTVKSKYPELFQRPAPFYRCVGYFYSFDLCISKAFKKKYSRKRGSNAHMRNDLVIHSCVGITF